MSKTKTARKRYRKLRRQLTLVILLFYIILMSLTLLAIYYSSTTSFLTAKNEMIERDLGRIKENYTSFDGFLWLMDYWKNNADEINTEYTQEEMESVDDFRIYDESGNFNVEYITSLPEKTRLAYAKEQYLIFRSGLQYEMSTFRYGKLFVIDISDEDRGFLYCEVNADNSEVHKPGDVIDYDLSEHPAAKAFLSDNYGEIEFEQIYDREKGGQRHYVGCMPITENGEVRALLCLGYNWDTFYDKLMGELKVIGSAILAGVLMIILLMVLVIDSLASEPLRMLKEAVRDYTEKHDGKRAAEQLSEIRSHNEIGELAEHFCALAARDNDNSADEQQKP